MKESFNLIYNRNFAEHNLTIDENMYLWEDVCEEITTRHNLLNVHDKIEEFYHFKFEDFNLSEIPEVFRKFIKDSPSNWDDLFTIYYEDFNYDLEVFEAGIQAGIDLDRIEECYVGQFSNDADFAQQLAEDLYDFKDIPSWVEIDWDATSVNIMYDYIEQDEHYFSNY